MKKVLLIVLALVVQLGAQTYTGHKSQSDKKYREQASGDSLAQMIYNVNSGLSQANIDSLQNIRKTTGTDSMTVYIKTFPNGYTYLDNRNSWDWARTHTVYRDTVKSTTDTITISVTEWSVVTIKGLSAGDSLYYALGITEPATYSILIPNPGFWNSTGTGNGVFVSGKLSITYFTKVFIKAYSGDNSIKQYQVTVEGF